jgi:hypothetical protein
MMTTTRDISIFKECLDGLIAHIYEHAFTYLVDDFMHTKNMYFLTDYNVWAHVYGNTCIVEAQTYTVTAYKHLKAALKYAASQTLSKELILKSAQECGIEIERKVKNMHVQRTVDTINSVHSLRWLPTKQLPATQAHTNTSVNTVFSNTTIVYGTKQPRQFDELTIDFRALRRNESDLSLKALDIFIIQAIGLNLLFDIRKEFTQYDLGDGWDNGAKTIRYRTVIGFEKSSQISQQDLELFIQKRMQDYSSKKFVDKVHTTLSKIYADERAQYFTIEKINEITNGLILGYKGWKAIATKKNIEQSINSLKVSVIE